MIRSILLISAYETRHIFAHKDLRLMCLVAPLLYGTLLSSVYFSGSLKDLKVGVIDRDNTPLTRIMTRWLDASSGIKISDRYGNVSEAQFDLLDGRIDGYVVIPAGFAEDIKRGEGAQSLLAVNASNIIKANPIIMSFTQASATASAALSVQYARKKGNTSQKALSLNQGLQTNITYIYNKDLEYSVFILPGILFMILQQILLVSLSFSIAEERQSGHMTTLLQQVNRNLPVLLGKAIPHAFLQFLYAIIFVWMLLPLFGIHAMSSVSILLPFMLVSVFSVAIFAATVSLFFKNTASALVALMFFSLPTFFLSGFSWPGAALPLPLKVLAFLLPSTHVLNEFRLLILGDMTWEAVAPSFLGLGAILGLYGTILCLIADFKDGRTRHL